MMKEVVLIYPATRRLVIHVATARHFHDKERRKLNAFDAKKALQNEIDSYGAEVAFCQLFNLFPDMATELKDKQPFDCIRNGVTIDVKQTVHEHGQLRCVHKKPDQEFADRFALMTGEHPNYIYRGEMDRGQLIVDDRYETLRCKTPYWWAAQHELEVIER